jgi:hypothetical protein
MEAIKTDHVLGRPVDVSRLPELAEEVRSEADFQLRSLTEDLRRMVGAAEDVVEKLESGDLTEGDRTKLARRLSGVVKEASVGLWD